MEDLIRIMIKALVDFPDDVVVQKIGSNSIAVYEIKVAKADMGKVVGKRGRNADALRTIVSAASAKHRQRSILEILE
ncbi:MAG: KH domain-containing protein [Desulfobacterales bacterium]